MRFLLTCCTMIMLSMQDKGAVYTNRYNLERTSE